MIAAAWPTARGEGPDSRFQVKISGPLPAPATTAAFPPPRAANRALRRLFHHNAS